MQIWKKITFLIFLGPFLYMSSKLGKMVLVMVMVIVFSNTTIFGLECPF